MVVGLLKSAVKTIVKPAEEVPIKAALMAWMGPEGKFGDARKAYTNAKQVRRQSDIGDKLDAIFKIMEQAYLIVRKRYRKGFKEHLEKAAKESQTKNARLKRFNKNYGVTYDQNLRRYIDNIALMELHDVLGSLVGSLEQKYVGSNPPDDVNNANAKEAISKVRYNMENTRQKRTTINRSFTSRTPKEIQVVRPTRYSPPVARRNANNDNNASLSNLSLNNNNNSIRQRTRRNENEDRLTRERTAEFIRKGQLLRR